MILIYFEKNILIYKFNLTLIFSKINKSIINKFN